MFPPKLNEVYHFCPRWNVVFVPTSLHDTNIWLESVSCAKIHLIYFVSDIDCLSYYQPLLSLLPSYSLHRTVIYLLYLKMFLQSKNQFAVNEISRFSQFLRRPLCRKCLLAMLVHKDYHWWVYLRIFAQLLSISEYCENFRGISLTALINDPHPLLTLLTPSLTSLSLYCFMWRCMLG